MLLEHKVLSSIGKAAFILKNKNLIRCSKTTTSTELWCVGCLLCLHDLKAIKFSSPCAINTHLPIGGKHPLSLRHSFSLDQSGRVSWPSEHFWFRLVDQGGALLSGCWSFFKSLALVCHRIRL